MGHVISFTVYGKPEPQGSISGFKTKRGAYILTSANRNLKSFRQEVSVAALVARHNAGFMDLVFGKHEPIELIAAFYLHRPPSIPKKRSSHAVKPDLSKLVRSIEDSLTGIIYKDDAQIVCYNRIHKFYGEPERVELTVRAYVSEVSQKEVDRPVLGNE
jgi:Holliday junction resolvase RusA-like endonuclease